MQAAKLRSKTRMRSATKVLRQVSRSSEIYELSPTVLDSVESVDSFIDPAIFDNDAGNFRSRKRPEARVDLLTAIFAKPAVDDAFADGDRRCP